MHRLARLDHQYLWHPFTQMGDWFRREPIVIVSGRGAVLRDVRGREYLDANASIWTNLHGHNHPRINAAVRRQLGKIAHSSALGFANEPASLLGERLVAAANPGSAGGGRRNAESGNAPSRTPGPQTAFPSPRLGRVFFSDDGSTAMEVAVKLAYEFARRTGRSRRPRFLCLQEAYHGDTIGAVSLGHIELFHRAYAGLVFKSDRVMAPYCYRCPFNRAKPERADAREYRKCKWECLGQVEQRFAAQKRRGNPYAAMVVEPLIQGAAGMIPQPRGWLARVAEIARGNGAQWIADEVMTAFGRTGVAESEVQPPGSKGLEPTIEARYPHPRRRLSRSDGLFACHREGVQPDYLAVAKGLTGGYLPMAATLTTAAVFDAFLGDYTELKTFFHGHSFTANQLGAAAALASLDLLQGAASVQRRRTLEHTLRKALPRLWPLPQVGDIRQVGLVAGVELVKDRRTREPFDLRDRAGIRVCEAMARRGVLTRPIGNVVVLMPPYCTTSEQAEQMVDVLGQAIAEVLGRRA
jgi:adenosylmethionine---8-amino-7-oxononanoate aminotransferase